MKGLLAAQGRGRPGSRVERQRVNQLNAAVNTILSKPEIKAAFLKEGAEARPVTPAQFAATIGQDVQRWKTLAKRQNIVAD